MKPFSAWLAMMNGEPQEHWVDCAGTRKFVAANITAPDGSVADAQRVLIVPDTEENRRRLGMEE